ncbi:MAG TPA: transcription-repair coupling factor [Bacteroidales bacterium]|nr:transcription-repair coupling factor [Bacteroidales bacterium]HPO65977.1 transcription-repair coupling factor [Bacteroidales bacterium]
MDLKTLQELISTHPKYNYLKDSIAQNPAPSHFQVSGLKGSARSLLVAWMAQQTIRTHLILLPDKEEAQYFAGDLVQLFEPTRVFLFPSSYKHPGQSTRINPAAVLQRAEILNYFTRPPQHATIIVTFTDAIAEKVAAHHDLTKNTLTVHQGEKIDMDFLRETLDEYGFQRVDFVYEPGQYAVRGSLIDVFSFAARYPFRIDFFDDVIDSIRSFDVESQLSFEKLDKVQILPDIKQIESTGSRVSLFEYLPVDTCYWISDHRLIEDQLNRLPDMLWEVFSEDDNPNEHQKPELIRGDHFHELLQQKQVIEFSSHQLDGSTQVIFNTSTQPAFHKKFDLLAEHLRENRIQGYRTIICSENEKQLDRLKEILQSIHTEVLFEPLKAGFHEGFADHDLKLCLYTDHQIFERYQRSRFEQPVKISPQHVIQELSDLHPGDYVVHIDHGIGIFGGIEKVEINGKWQEVIKLVYKDNDVLYVGVNSLHRISKYRGKDGEPPKIYKLGSNNWQKLKQVTKKKIKDISRELIALYAKRIETKGFSFSPDTYLQQELEASFIYEDTPDQEKATRLVKQAMESEHPADILVCGDVGFGKTEVAIRAAFKAATDGKQTAVLVPTTILALQHYKTFSERLKDFPVKVEYISRNRKPADVREILRRVEKGEVDILIGTHKLLSGSVKFKDLGLLIIDEEQKFGVAMKEKLKAMKVNIDCLSLSATPIPRTLQFSLMGARDLAIINTPPPNRFPIITEVHTFNEQIIRQGILNELARGGQVFFIHNRVQTIYEIEKKLHQIVPEARIAVTHGQMDGEQLENTIFAFINGDYDVLLTTAIIESGVDIPNVNTIFIMDAQNFGLSDLHQLRGRVGRSNRKAFCYLLIPSYQLLTAQAKRRLKAIEENSELGSGFQIAMLDLDIRGAGNLLGAEQSGFIAEMGYETYLSILQEAIQEVKEEEYRHLFFKEEARSETAKETINVLQTHQFVLDCQIDTDFEIMLPESYIENITERIRLYRELDAIKSEEDLKKFEHKLIDRFGPIPEPAQQLMDIVRLRRLAMELGFERISIKNERMTVYFVQNQQSPYYQSEIFGHILQYVQRHPQVFRFRDSSDKPAMYTQGIKNVQMAIELLKKLKPTTATTTVLEKNVEN